jgi:hypothetical protein
MSFEIAVDQLRTHVRVTISGSPSLEAFLSMLHLIGIESEEWKARAVMFDLRGVRTKFKPAEHVEIGVQVAASMHHVERVAALVRPHRYTQAGERVARRDGLDVRMFVNVDEAVAWLNEAARMDAARGRMTAARDSPRPGEARG